MRGPSTFVSVDETLYPYRRKIGIKQCNPVKPAMYGLLYRSYAMLKFHIRISHYGTMVNLTVLIMNIILEELMSIRNI